MKTYDLTQFIETFVIPDLKKMVDSELHYYAFAVICQGIEVLGSIYDQRTIEDYGVSESRFDNTLTNLFADKRYREKQKLFFSVLRGPLIHQLRPGKGLFIASVQKDKIAVGNHLTKHAESESIILVIEQFYADFLGAFDQFKKELARRNDLDKAKVTAPFIFIGKITPPVASTEWDPATKTTLTITPAITGRAF